MDVAQQGVASNHNHNGDGDADLSFEALTFGEDSHGSNHHQHHHAAGGQQGTCNNNTNNISSNGNSNFKKDSKANKKKGFKKERSSNGGPQLENEKDKSTSSVYVSTRGGGEGGNNSSDQRIDVPALLKRLEQFGVVKAYYFKEKQNFGFIQFLDASVLDTVIENINNNPFQTEDGTVQLIAERAAGKAGQNGESPQSFGATGMLGASANSFGTNFGIPFSPSTPAGSSLASASSSGGAGNGSGLSALASPNPAASISSPTPEKPDTILVLKNLPFSLKQDQLQEILMMMNTTAPQSINLHFDNMGVFRGMAFIKYRLLDDAIKVYEALNGYDVGGRKVRVEYKRKNKGQQTDVPLEWQEEEDLKKLWEQAKDFSNNPNVNEISFTPNLTSNQRKQIHAMAEKLKLTHYSNGEGEQRYICIKKPPPTTTSSSSSSTTTNSPSMPSSSNTFGSSSQSGFALPIPTSNGGRRPRRDSDTAAPSSSSLRHGSPIGSSNLNHTTSNGISGSVENKSEYRPRLYNKKEVASSAPADISMDWRNQNQNLQSQIPSPAQSPSLAGVTIAPSRQPKGPDGSKGFSDLYRSARKHACTFVDSASAAVLEIPAVV